MGNPAPFASRIIPIFLIHRPKNNIPYATVEEELIGEFVKYSIRDGKEINFLRRESEAGQKCCTFQHWVYQKTSGSLLVTDMQGKKTSFHCASQDALGDRMNKREIELPLD